MSDRRLLVGTRSGPSFATSTCRSGQAVRPIAAGRHPTSASIAHCGDRSVAVYTRASWLDAPLAAVWTFHTSTRGLVTASPGWLGVRVESVRGPEGHPDPDRWTVGTTIEFSTRPGGIGPRRRWIVRITGRARSDSAAWFRDELVVGPARRWIHTHRFRAHDHGTRLIDTVEYELPGLGRASWLAKPLFALVFAARHRRTARAISEG